MKPLAFLTLALFLAAPLAAPVAAQAPPPDTLHADSPPAHPAPADAAATGEVEPVLIGGMRALMAQVRYPEMARRQRVQGRVPVRIVVERDGTVSGAECLRDPGAGLCAAALEAVCNARFEPGRLDGQPVRTTTTLDLRFRLRR